MKRMFSVFNVIFSSRCNFFRWVASCPWIMCVHQQKDHHSKVKIEFVFMLLAIQGLSLSNLPIFSSQSFTVCRLNLPCLFELNIFSYNRSIWGDLFGIAILTFSAWSPFSKTNLSASPVINPWSFDFVATGFLRLIQFGTLCRCHDIKFPPKQNLPLAEIMSLPGDSVLKQSPQCNRISSTTVQSLPREETAPKF